MTRGERAAIAGVAALVALVAAFAPPALQIAADWAAVQWQQPWALALLVLVPLVAWRGTAGEDLRVPRMRVAWASPLLAGPKGLRAHLRDVPGVVRAVAIVPLVLALARPVSALRPETSSESGIDIVLVMDLSGSMRAVFDAPAQGGPKSQGGPRRPTRLDTAKVVIRDFISRRKTDRIGVVVFGKEAYVLAPPTLDYQLLDALVDRMALDVIDGSGTAIGNAVGVAAARLRRSDARSKAVVLLTDGDSNAGSVAPEYAAQLAGKVGAKIFTIQIGNGDDVDVQDGVDLFGQPHYVRQRFPVNPALLQKLAADTGGAAYVASDGRALTASMHDVLDKLEKTRFEAASASYEDLFPVFLLPGVLLVAVDALLRSLVLRRYP